MQYIIFYLPLHQTRLSARMNIIRKNVTLLLMCCLTWTYTQAQELLEIDNVAVFDAQADTLLAPKPQRILTLAIDEGGDEPLVRLTLFDNDSARVICQALLGYGQQYAHGIVLTGKLPNDASAIDYNIVDLTGKGQIFMGLVIYKRKTNEKNVGFREKYLIGGMEYDQITQFIRTAVKNGIIKTL